MAWPPEKQAKAQATRERNRALREAKAKGKDAHVAIASTKDVPNDREKRLLDEINELRAKLEVSEVARGEAEAAALKSAEAQGMLMQRQIEEVPTGKKVKVQRLDKYKVVGHKEDGRDILKPVFKTVEIETYFYKIDMPPVGGLDLKINDIPFYHGAVYELDIDTLRTVKSMVYNLWRHDADIHGSDENFYRKQQRPVLSARAR